MLPSVAETDSYLSVFHTALEIRNDIKSTRVFRNCNGINKENAAKVVPDSLYLFLRMLFTGENELGETSANASIHNRVLSISQYIIFAVTNGRKLTPKHVGLGLTVHQATRSKSLVDLLYSAGHSISYDMVRRVDTTLANRSLEVLKSNDNIQIPTRIEHDSFVQFAADNIDLIEETLDGKGTFHATQMIAIQRSTNTQLQDDDELPIGKAKSLSVPDELHKLKVAPVSAVRPAPLFSNDVSLSWYNPGSELFKVGERTDLARILSRLAGSQEQSVPSWTGFNSAIFNDMRAKSNIGYLPIINAPAHEDNTLWTVIQRCLHISDSLNSGQSTVLTSDQQLYCKGKELQWANAESCKKLVVRLGSFHIALNFMKVIGQISQTPAWLTFGLKSQYMETILLRITWLQSHTTGQ